MKEKEITISIVYIFGIHITVRRPDWKKMNFIVFSPDPPHQVELRSSGKAGEYQGDLLGVYQMLPEPGRGGDATYRQLHDTNDQHYYLYRFGIVVPHAQPWRMI